MRIDGDGNNLRELNHQLQGENERVEDVVRDDDINVNDPAENINDSHEGALRAPIAALQIPQQQQSQGSIVCWERFLHLRSIKVLLVENDYSTRHVVTALLRNCSYEVIEAANGLQAWKILEDLNIQIDLVLTEAVMPGLSGIGLLYKIMSHITRNNVPVIMMSSHDSMGLVFKCLSKGAADFLVKPIRKNELKNLWQHVWRRCHSSSGSGSESGTQTEKSVKLEGVERSDNNSGSNDKNDNGSMGLNVGDGSDNGSGTQSSWTKQAVEEDSSHPASPEDQVAECPDSTCAQVNLPNAGVSGNKQASEVIVKDCEGCKKQLDDEPAKDEEKVVLGNVDLQFIHQVEDPVKFVGMKQKHLLEKGSGKLKEQIDSGHLDLNIETPSSTLNCPANLKGSFANSIGPFTKISSIEASTRKSKISDSKLKALDDTKETPFFEHGLKRLREEKDVETAIQDDHNACKRSDASPFSRYHASSNANKAPGVIMKSGGSPLDSTSDKTRKGSVCDLLCHSNGDHPNQCSNVGSNNVDMGSTTNHNKPESVILKNSSTVSSSVKYLHTPSSFEPSKGDLLYASQQILSSKELAAVVPHCGSSNVLGGPVEGTCGNYYSVNGSASGSNHGSNHGSNGQNGSSNVVNNGGINLESVNGVAGKSGSGDGSGSGSGDGNRVDQVKVSEREVALTKFPEKRKERCFRKKVHNQSRKKLSEQRPQVRGQFVRQTTNDSSSEGTDSQMAP